MERNREIEEKRGKKERRRGVEARGEKTREGRGDRTYDVTEKWKRRDKRRIRTRAILQ